MLFVELICGNMNDIYQRLWNMPDIQTCHAKTVWMTDDLLEFLYGYTRHAWQFIWRLKHNLRKHFTYKDIKAGTSNSLPPILWDVITCPCPWYLLLTQHSSHRVHFKKYMCMVNALLCIVSIWWWLPVSFRVTSLALGQSYDCQSASEATLNNKGKYLIRILII